MPSQAESRAKAMRAVQSLFDRYESIAARRPADRVDFDRQLFENLKLVDAGLDGHSVFEFTIPQAYSNFNNVMHGGAAGVIFDVTTTTAISPLARPGYWYFSGGVTRTLNVSYLRAVPIGTRVLLSSRVVQVGKTMAMLKGEMTSLDGKIVYATAEHHKVNLPLTPDMLGGPLPWDDEVEADMKREEEEKLERAKL